MEEPIVNKLKKWWDAWDIPACVLISLSLQVFLVLFASLRKPKRSTSPFLLFLIWSAYLSADYVAAFTIGLITKVQVGTHPLRGRRRELYAFWASFLLLHLGGPDTITSFALEDNQLWLRHLFGLIFQVVAAAYCFFLTLPSNRLWIPTVLVLAVGTLKYAERTMALFLGSLEHFAAAVARLPKPTNAEYFTGPSEYNPMELLMLSYTFFKGLLSGPAAEALFYRIMVSPNVAFKLVEHILNFTYEVLYSKVCVVCGRIGLALRLSSFCFMFGAFLVFHFTVDHHHQQHDEFGGFDMPLTYTLLIGAMILDTISGIKLMLSDCVMASNGFKRWRKYIPQYILNRKTRWQSVSLYNMIDYCLHERWLWSCNLPDFVRDLVLDKIKFMLFSSSADDIEDLKCFIFEKLDNKYFVEFVKYNIVAADIDHYIRFTNLTDKLRYREQILQLHLITEIAYRRTQNESRNYSEEVKKSRRMCKLISDYMFYLLIMKPELLRLSLMGTQWKTTFQDTFVEAKKNLMKIINNDYSHVEEKGMSSRSNSVLSNAYSCAQDLLGLENNWENLSFEWTVVFCIAANGNRHATVFLRGKMAGEFLTLIMHLIQFLGL